MLSGEEDTVVFINGAWVTPRCWRFFTQKFHDASVRVLAPAWPCKDRPLAEQIDNPDPKLGRIGIPEIVEHYRRIIAGLPKPPVLIGHSFGGLIVQILLDRGYGAAGIAISSVPPRGVKPFDLFSRQARETLLTLLRSQPGFGGILRPLEPNSDIQTAFVPESWRIFWQLATRAADVNFSNANAAPLLLVACGKDRRIPSATVLRNFEKYDAARPRRVECVQFANFSHFSIAEAGSERLASYCLDWAAEHVFGRQESETEDDAYVLRAG